MFYTDFGCTMNFLHHRGGGVNSILTAPIKVPWCDELLGLFLKKIIHLSVLLHMYPQKTWVRAGKVTRDAFVWLFSTVCFQMLTQQPCLRRCKVTLVAFVCFFSTVCYQSVYPRGGIVTLIAFVWLFSTVRLQCLLKWLAWEEAVTLVAFVWLFATVRFQMCSQIAELRKRKFALVAFV